MLGFRARAEQQRVLWRLCSRLAAVLAAGEPPPVAAAQHTRQVQIMRARANRLVARRLRQTTRLGYTQTTGALLGVLWGS
jgi:hypothetical protein